MDERIEVRYTTHKSVGDDTWWCVSARYWNGTEPVASVVINERPTHSEALRLANRYARDAINADYHRESFAFRYRIRRRAAR